MHRKRNSISKCVTSIWNVTLFLWYNLSALFAVKIFRCVSSQFPMFYLFRFDSVSLPEKENKIRGGKSTEFTPPLNDFTHAHVHVYRHTRTRLPAHAHIRIHVAFNVHAIMDLHKCALSFSSPPQEFSKIHAYKRDFTDATFIANKDWENLWARSGGVYRGVFQVIALLLVLFYD